jgi:hypothetical protein
VDDYRAVLTSYINRRKTRGPLLPATQGSGIRDRIADEMIGQLDALDERRTDLRAGPRPPLTATQAVPDESP